MASTVLLELERKLERIRDLPREPAPETVPTGIPPLDDLLPGHGLPRGRAVEWLGPRSCGKTAVLRAALGRLHGRGEAVAVVDPSRTLYAPDWAELAGRTPFWVVRPARPEEVAWCADLLLRSGAFGAVALETGLALPRPVTVRLQRLAEETDSLFLVVGELPLAALRLRFRPGRLEPVVDTSFGTPLPPLRPVWAGLGKGGEREVPILCPVPPDRAPRPAARDRKGRR